MADNEITVTDLEIRATTPRPGVMDAVVLFTSGAETWQVTIRGVSHDKVRQLLQSVEITTALTDRTSGLVIGDNFQIGMQS